MKQKYTINGMSCAHCVSRIEEAVSSLDGVKKIKINLKKAEAIVKFDEQCVTDEVIISTIHQLGFTASI
ncbi:copper chaperone CopZ [Vagococcus xieshaowenii]|uniref:Copper chaperone CopZ n=1 Tax=Vagococcus xieshaowenii TaxID=2562451 RepID=A0A4Z0D6V2_9ENTE|nr:copper chaperone CopZ [Vagococcus xieshaowenii]QCA28570.1 copper chaperone CopZ [Vagococcus xieshaowenii]TFZ40622.1 copper chaperone CopZ [Vagococcus xieshaowenii]